MRLGKRGRRGRGRIILFKVVFDRVLRVLKDELWL